MTECESRIIHELVRRNIKGNLNPIIESIYLDATKNNLKPEVATHNWIRENMKKDKEKNIKKVKLKEESRMTKGNSKYEAVYLPYNSKGANSPETVASQLKVFFAPDNFTALVYAIALVSADREEYFPDNKNITKKAALNYVYDFLYPESFPTGLKKSNITLGRLYDMLQDSQNDDGTGDWEPDTDYGYLFSLTDDKGNYIYKGDLEPHDWNYESFIWWHNGDLKHKYSAYLGQPDDVIEDHLPKRRF